MKELDQVPEEFDFIQTWKGYTMKGWDFTRTDIAQALRDNRMLNPAFEVASNICPWNCGFCFTEDPNHPLDEKKRRLEGEMTLEERFSLIDQAAALGARSINHIGAGEPTFEEDNFWKIVERISGHGMTPIIYTEGSLRLRDPAFARRLYDSGATVVLKVNSLWNREYQNAVVKGGKERRSPLEFSYFDARNEALEVLMKTGFNQHDPTRLAFDTIICKENYDEITRLHRFARDNNIFVLFVNYLPSGRTTSLPTNAVSRADQFAMFDELARIDRTEYGLTHKSIFPYAGGTPCSIRGLGLYVKIQGQAFDCPGELAEIGNVRDTPLTQLWKRTRYIRESFDGGCAPREAAWAKQGLPGAVPLSISATTKT